MPTTCEEGAAPLTASQPAPVAAQHQPQPATFDLSNPQASGVMRLPTVNFGSKGTLIGILIFFVISNRSLGGLYRTNISQILSIEHL